MPTMIAKKKTPAKKPAPCRKPPVAKPLPPVAFRYSLPPHVANENSVERTILFEGNCNHSLALQSIAGDINLLATRVVVLEADLYEAKEVVSLVGEEAAARRDELNAMQADRNLWAERASAYVNAEQTFGGTHKELSDKLLATQKQLAMETAAADELRGKWQAEVQTHEQTTQRATRLESQCLQAGQDTELARQTTIRAAADMVAMQAKLKEMKGLFADTLDASRGIADKAMASYAEETGHWKKRAEAAEAENVTLRMGGHKQEPKEPTWRCCPNPENDHSGGCSACGQRMEAFRRD